MRNAPLAAEAKGASLTLITALRTAPTGGVITPIAAGAMNITPKYTGSMRPLSPKVCETRVARPRDEDGPPVRSVKIRGLGVLGRSIDWGDCRLGHRPMMRTPRIAVDGNPRVEPRTMVRRRVPAAGRDIDDIAGL
jgi:hypothetical protein